MSQNYWNCLKKLVLLQRFITETTFAKQFYFKETLYFSGRYLYWTVSNLTANTYFLLYQLEILDHSTKTFESFSIERSVFCPFLTPKLHLCVWIQAMRMYEYSEYSVFLHALKVLNSTVCWLSLCGLVTSRITSNILLEKKEKKRIFFTYLLFQDTSQKQYESDYQLPNYEGYPQNNH